MKNAGQVWPLAECSSAVDHVEEEEGSARIIHMPG